MNIAVGLGEAAGSFLIPGIIFSIGLVKRNAAIARLLIVWGLAVFLIYCGYIGGGQVLRIAPLIGWTCALAFGAVLTLRARKQPQP